MPASSRLPLAVRLVLASVMVTLGSSCVVTTPYYSGQSPGGGYYVAAAPPRWEFAPWGLVKSNKAPPKKEWNGDGSFWKGDDISGKPRIHIKVEEQMAFFYKGDMLVGASPVCTGSDDFPTPRGNFSVQEKDEDHISSLYGDYVSVEDGLVVKAQVDHRKDPRPPGTKFDGAKMHWFLRVTGAVGMHEGYLPGFADSHGCIRLPAHMAPIFYKHAPLGTPVKITD